MCAKVSSLDHLGRAHMARRHHRMRDDNVFHAVFACFPHKQKVLLRAGVAGCQNKIVSGDQS